MQDAPGGAENTRCHIDKMTTMSQGKLSPIFSIVVFRRERCETKEAVRKDAEAPWKSPCPACVSQWGQPSLSAMTHSRWAHGQSGHESTDYTLRVVHFLSVGCKPGPSICARTRTRANVNVRPRPSVVNATGAIQKNNTPVVRC